MRPIRDPEEAELSHLLAVCELKGKSVLEIGCGDGKFIRQYAREARKTIGIDPDIDDLRTGVHEKQSKNYWIDVACAMGEHLPFPADIFDVAIFASSL